jgi:hypothetical protein
VPPTRRPLPPKRYRTELGWISGRSPSPVLRRKLLMPTLPARAKKEEHSDDDQAQPRGKITSPRTSEDDNWGSDWKAPKIEEQDEGHQQDEEGQDQGPQAEGHQQQQHEEQHDVDHNRRRRNPEEVCRFFRRRGWCKFGAKCDYLHTDRGSHATEQDEKRAPYNKRDFEDGKHLIQLLRRDNRGMDSEGFRALDEVARQAGLAPWRVLDVVQRNHRFEVRFHSIAGKPTQPFIRALGKHRFPVHLEQPDMDDVQPTK